MQKKSYMMQSDEIDTGPMEFDSFVKKKKDEAVQRMLLAKYMEGVAQKSSSSVQNNSVGISCSTVEHYRYQMEISSTNTESDGFPTQQLILNPLHQKFHKARLKSWFVSVPKGILELMCKGGQFNNRNKEFQQNLLKITEYANGKKCKEVTKVVCVNAENKIILTRCTPILVPPGNLKITGFVDGTEIKHTTNEIKCCKGNQIFECVDGVTYELRGMFADPNGNSEGGQADSLSLPKELQGARQRQKTRNGLLRVHPMILDSQGDQTVSLSTQKELDGERQMQRARGRPTKVPLRKSCSDSEVGQTESLSSQKELQGERQLQRSRCGRERVPPVKHWLGERFVQRKERAVVINDSLEVIKKSYLFKKQSGKETVLVMDREERTTKRKTFANKSRSVIAEIDSKEDKNRINDLKQNTKHKEKGTVKQKNGETEKITNSKEMTDRSVWNTDEHEKASGPTQHNMKDSQHVTAQKENQYQNNSSNSFSDKNISTISPLYRKSPMKRKWNFPQVELESSAMKRKKPVHELKNKSSSFSAVNLDCYSDKYLSVTYSEVPDIHPLSDTMFALTSSDESDESSVGY